MRVDAIPFDKSVGKISYLPIVSSIYAYDNPNTFFTILLRINHKIYIKDMKHSLICPNQACEYGTIIDNIPPHLDHMVTVTFTITSGYYNLPLVQYGPTAYISPDVQQKTNLNISLSLTSQMSTNGIPTSYPTIFMPSIQHQYSTRRVLYLMINLLITG